MANPSFPFVDSGGTGSGSGSLEVFDEGVSLGSFTEMNFVGADIQATANGSQAIIFSPVPTNASFFNQNLGTTNAVVPNISVTTRNVSNPTSEGTPFKKGSWSAGQSISATNSGTWVYTPPGAFSIFNSSTTTFRARLYDSDGTTVLNEHLFTITGNYSATVNNITINITGFVADSGKFKANISISYALSIILSNGGRVSVELRHDNATDGIFTKTQNDIFYDSNNNLASGSGLSISESAGFVVTRPLSGILYYTTGSRFTSAIADLDYLNDRSYPSTQVIVDAPLYGLSAISITGAGLTGWTNAWDNTNASYLNTNWQISTSNYSTITTVGQSTGVIQDWSNVPLTSTANSPILVDTYSDNSTRIYEDFRSESRRLTSSYGTWDGTNSLLTYDGSLGLQVAQSRLIYPTLNFSTYNPNLGTQYNYSTASSNRVYYSSFYKVGTSFTNGIFTFGDHNLLESDITGSNVLVDISLNGTDFYSLNLDWTGFPLLNGDGCRINTGTQSITANNTLQFTLAGQFTSVTTGDPTNHWGIIFRITIKSTVPSKYIGVFQISWI
jgi:hypothetical protein